MARRQTRNQRNRQQQLRDAHRAERRPERDDFARILLFRVISGLLKTGRLAKLDELEDALVGELVAQGFAERPACEVFEASWSAIAAATVRSGARFTCRAEGGVSGWEGDAFLVGPCLSMAWLLVTAFTHGDLRPPVTS